MILIYTGNGKGKTSACVGQAARALGQGLNVAFGQFMKRDGQAGEQRMLAQWLGECFLAGGEGFLRRKGDLPAHREAALRVLAWAHAQLRSADMLILDETLYALGAGILEREEVEDLLVEARTRECHLVLSGRNAPEWLLEAADLVTEMIEIKHPWRAGVQSCARHRILRLSCRRCAFMWPGLSNTSMECVCWAANCAPWAAACWIGRKKPCPRRA